MWSETNGEPDDPQRNRAYWLGREQGEQNFYTGFRIYASRTSSNFLRSGDAEPTTYKMHDFGLVKQVEVKKIEGLEENIDVSNTEETSRSIALEISMMMGILFLNLW